MPDEVVYSVDTRSVALDGSHRKNALAQEHITAAMTRARIC
ncbi:hypothetical protein ACVXG7_19780 [Enterobacter hormaechei]